MRISVGEHAAELLVIECREGAAQRDDAQRLDALSVKRDRAVGRGPRQAHDARAMTHLGLAVRERPLEVGRFEPELVEGSKRQQQREAAAADPGQEPPDLPFAEPPHPIVSAAPQPVPEWLAS